MGVWGRESRREATKDEGMGKTAHSETKKGDHRKFWCHVYRSRIENVGEKQNGIMGKNLHFCK